MNLVAPINPVYWSRFLPELKLASDLQQGEGFAYFGLGILLLALGGAVAALVRPPARATVNALTPVLLTTGVLLLVAISPKVTFGSHVLFELPQVLYAPFAPFRASGRFVLPAFYLMLFLLLWLVAHRLPGWAASAVLIVVLWVQLADIGGRLNGIRDQAARGAELHVWKQPLSWEAWRFATDSYRRMLLVPPDDWDHEKALPFAYLAARSGMATTAGYAARSDKAAMQAARRRLKEQLVAGELDRDAVYIVDARYLSQFQQNFGDRVSCRVVDGFDACIPR